VTLDQYQKLQNIDTSELEGQIEAATILLGVNTDDMTWVEFCKELNKLDFLTEPIPKTIVRNSYMLNGRKYNCFVNLQDLTVSRYMDFENLSKTKDLVKILAVFLIPDGKEYGTYDLNEVYEDIKTMNIVEASGIFNFFPLEFRICIEVLKDYSIKELKKNPELQNLVSEAMELCSMSDL
jgi:hypothetical protein